MNNNELLRYMKGLSGVIGQALTAEGISGQLVRAKQGPLTLTYQVRLLGAKHGQIQRAKVLGEVMESYSGVGPVRVTTSVGQLIIEFPSPVICTPHASLLASYSRGANLVVGFDHWGEPVHLNLSRYPNLLVVGPPRSGKSSAMRSLAYSALRLSNRENIKVEMSVCAEKAEYWWSFTDTRGFAGMLVEKDQAEGYLHELYEETVFRAKNQRRFNPVQFVVIDDLMSMLTGNDAMAKAISGLVSTGGSVGVYVLIGTQSAGSRAGTGGIAVEDNIMARLLYRATSRSSAARGTGEGSEGLSDLTNEQGDALFVLGTTKVRVATGYVSDEDIKNDLPTRDHELKIKHREVQHRGEEKSQIELPTLPKIKPARKLTQEEAAQVLDYLLLAQELGKEISQRQLLLALFEGKNATYTQHLKDALGDNFEQFFRTKNTAIVEV